MTARHVVHCRVSASICIKPHQTSAENDVNYVSNAESLPSHCTTLKDSEASYGGAGAEGPGAHDHLRRENLLFSCLQLNLSVKGSDLVYEEM
eukprot:scaffold132571_cov17-Tisochrysis_lutea.AAC.1